jgi:hypothetical protein
VLSLLAATSAWSALDCAACHRTISQSFAATPHANTSRVANAESIAGSFARGRDLLTTGSRDVYFRMEKRGDAYYLTGVQGRRSQTERVDMVIGSGRRGQSYLYWRDGLLFQLPVSWHAGSRSWIMSPGYEERQVHFGRAIPPGCLNCHGSGFRVEIPAGGKPRYAADYTLGMSCASCHGEPEHHQEIKRPAGVDLCAGCHSGIAEEGTAEPDVHGNQVALFKTSRCFLESGGTMTCTTCHDVHRVQRDTSALSSRCSICHGKNACPKAAGEGGVICIDCHMPLMSSKLIAVQKYRTHRIAVYRRQ